MGWPLVLTSAAIGAVVSSLIAVIGQAIERRARTRELLISKALELGFDNYRRAMEVKQLTGRAMRIQDPIVSAETYFEWLEYMFNHGRLPEDPRLRRIVREDE